MSRRARYARALLAAGLALGWLTSDHTARAAEGPLAHDRWGITAELRIDGKPARRFLFTYSGWEECNAYARLLQKRHGLAEPPRCRPLDSVPKPGEKEL